MQASMQGSSSTPSLPTQVCQSCGNVLLNDETFCRRCGARRALENLSMNEVLLGTRKVQVLPPSSVAVEVQAATPSMGAVGFDTSLVNTYVTAVDRNLDGIPDGFQKGYTTPPQLYAPTIGATTRIVSSPPHSPAPGPTRMVSINQASPAASYAPPAVTSYVMAPSMAPMPTTTILPSTTVTQMPSSMPSPSMGVVSISQGDYKSQISPALAAWIEARIEQSATTRVEQAIQQLAAGEMSNVISTARREAQGAAQTTLQQAEHREMQLKSEVREMWETQSRVLALFEGISKDAERYFNNNKTKSEALMTVEKVMSTIDELHRSVEQDADGASAKLRQHEVAIVELRRSQAEELAKQKAALAEVQRVQGETQLRQRKNSDDLATACNTIAGTRQEAGDLAQLVQRLETKLSSWRAELTAEVADEVRAIARERELEAENDRLKIDTLTREIRDARGGCGELEARLEGFRIELSTAVNARAELERRLKESHQTLVNRIESVYSGPVKELENFHQEIEGLSQQVHRSEQRTNAWRADVTKEIRFAATTEEQKASEMMSSITAVRHETELIRHEAASSIETLRREVQEVASGFETFRREVSSSIENLRREATTSNAARNELEGCLERLQVELTTLVATRDAFEFRSREGHEELRKAVDSWMHRLPEEMSALSQRITTDVKSEMRAAIKNEQNSIAAIDEQLWLTDQRLGNRIDELAHAQERVAVMVQVNNERNGVKVSPKALDTHDRKVIVEDIHVSADMQTGAASRIRISNGATSDSAHAYAFSEGFRETKRLAPRSPSAGGRSPSASLSLSGEEQLERLRSGRRQLASSHSDKRLLVEETVTVQRSPTGARSPLAMAHKAAEIFHDIGKGD